MKIIDARGLSCPEPVVLLRSAMESKENAYQIIVDNHASRENTTRYAQHQGYGVAWRMMPVPRDLSSSCGTCVRCEGGYLPPGGACAEEIEQIAAWDGQQYTTVYHTDETED